MFLPPDARRRGRAGGRARSSASARGRAGGRARSSASANGRRGRAGVVGGSSEAHQCKAHRAIFKRPNQIVSKISHLSVTDRCEIRLRFGFSYCARPAGGRAGGRGRASWRSFRIKNTPSAPKSKTIVFYCPVLVNWSARDNNFSCFCITSLWAAFVLVARHDSSSHFGQHRAGA